MATANVGKVVLLPKGNWSNSTTYNYLDFVLHNGSSWVSKTNGNVGHEPSASDTTNWQVLATAAEEVTVESQTLAYASQSVSAFNGNPPTTGWQNTVPAVSAGDYLWVRTTTEFSDGNSFNSYNVTKYGTNGTGVGTVTGAKLGASGTLIEPTDGVLIFGLDATPTDSSTNLVNSGGIAQRIYQVVSQMVAKLTSGTTRKVYIHEGATQSDLEIDETATANSANLITSGAVAKKVDIQQGSANAGKVMTVGADGTLSPQTPSGGVTIDLLWENASPLSSFNPQTISLDLTTYNLVGILFEGIDGADAETPLVISGIGKYVNLTISRLNVDLVGTAALNMFYRRAHITNSGIQFESGNMYYNNEVYKDWNNRAIPIAIYGIKGVSE